ncbi:MAG: sigma 54-interacting transcriptional regulator [Myxococcales bacterium]|nr:sigma 54-interacting transcriptional regulator [Myxococcales bacterium]
MTSPPDDGAPQVTGAADETIRVVPASGYRLAPTVRRFRLTNEGDQTDTEFLTGRCQVGSHAGAELQLTDPTVSRFHCEIVVEGQRAIVKDLGSTNGTFIDGVRVKEGYLRHGSVLSVGNSRLRFDLDEKVSALPVSQQAQFGTLRGNSSSMRQAFMLLEKAGKSDATVLLEGETGTGKSRAAQALHAAGARKDGPFLVVDCGALPASLLEAELFGHEKGAFTGAAGRRLGVFEEAKGGTVFLDEIGEMPLELQPRLLRVLEDRQVRRLGQNQWTAVDVRIVAATHRDLRADVNAGKFRSDLYFRLAVVRVTLPSLREHAEDVPDIARELLKDLGATERSHPFLFSPEFIAQLTAATWPGNVRELRNHLERCIVFETPEAPGRGDVVTNPGAGADFTRGPLVDARKRAVERFEKEYLTALLARHNGKVSQAAVEAEVDRVSLYRLMRKIGLKPE